MTAFPFSAYNKQPKSLSPLILCKKNDKYEKTFGNPTASSLYNALHTRTKNYLSIKYITVRGTSVRFAEVTTSTAAIKVIDNFSYKITKLVNKFFFLNLFFRLRIGWHINALQIDQMSHRGSAMRTIPWMLNFSHVINQRLHL